MSINIYYTPGNIHCIELSSCQHYKYNYRWDLRDPHIQMKNLKGINFINVVEYLKILRNKYEN